MNCARYVDIEYPLVTKEEHWIASIMEHIAIDRVAPSDFDRVIGGLVDIIVDAVNGGAAITFMQPFTFADGEQFLRQRCFPAVAKGERVLFVAHINNAVVGSAQLDLALPPNQPHRCEVSKVIVHSKVRRRGIARLLMLTLEVHARSIGKSLMTLDTRTDDAAQLLYSSLGFVKVGAIPNYAYNPDGHAMHGATYMYKEI
jgi:ribosomal protein S18 acetylase RimI-like enzyme